MTNEANYLVFGDLHGRILPAFQFAKAWMACTSTQLDGLIQVGDLGYFPDISRIDKATLKHAQNDPMELGALDIVTHNKLADQILNAQLPKMWFTVGNHEDFGLLEELSFQASGQSDFSVDAYEQVFCVRDGRVVTLPGGCELGAIWGVDGESESRRKKLPKRAYIYERSVTQLMTVSLDVLLTHDSAFDTKRPGSGSVWLKELLTLNPPKFHFFGHYKGPGCQVSIEGPCQSFFLTGFEMRTRNGTPEKGSVGHLHRTASDWLFDFVPPELLAGFDRSNWKQWQ